MFGKRRGEMMSAGPGRDEIERIGHRRVERCFDRGFARIADRRRRQANAGITIIRRIGGKIRLRQRTVHRRPALLGLDTIDHRRVRLQHDALAQTVDEYTGHHRPFLRHTGFLLDHRGEYHGLLFVADGQLPRTCCPKSSYNIPLRALHAADDRATWLVAGEAHGIRRDAAFRDRRQFPAQEWFGHQRRAHLIAVPAFGDGDLVDDDLTARDLADDLCRGHAGQEMILTCFECRILMRHNDRQRGDDDRGRKPRIMQLLKRLLHTRMRRDDDGGIRIRARRAIGRGAVERKAKDSDGENEEDAQENFSHPL